jgi:hypothetical protein
MLTITVAGIAGFVKGALFLGAGVSAVRWRDIRKGFLSTPAIATLLGLLALPTLLTMADLTVGSIVNWIPFVGAWLGNALELTWGVIYPIIIAAYVGGALVSVVVSATEWVSKTVMRWKPLRR